MVGAGGRSLTLRQIRAGALALAVGPALGAIAVPSATACSCVAITSAQAFASADVVFTGIAISRTPTPPEPVFPTPDPVLWAFEVESVAKGVVGDTVRVEAALGSASCGFEFRVGTRYSVFAIRHEGRLTTGLCSGTTTNRIPRPPDARRIRGALGRTAGGICRARRVARTPPGSESASLRRLRREAVDTPALRTLDAALAHTRPAGEMTKLVTLLRRESAAIDSHLSAIDQGGRDADPFPGLHDPVDRADLAIEMHLAAIGGPACTRKETLQFQPASLATRVRAAVVAYENAAVRMSSRPTIMRERADGFQTQIRLLEDALRALERTATASPAKRRWKAEALRRGWPVARTLRAAIAPARRGDVAAIARTRVDLATSGPAFAQTIIPPG